MSNFKPLFSIVTCGRDEAKVLPRLLDSLKEFFVRGGDMVFVDTGSKDNTAQIARDAGARVFEEGDRFRYVVDEENAKAINDKFVVEPDPPIIKSGDSFFAFDKARNYAMGLATNDFLCTPDCDEAWTVLNIDKLNELIEAGWEKLFVNFVFSHFPDGSPACKFAADTRFYDRRVIKWKGIIHETMQGNAKTLTIGEDVAYLEHYQNEETDRSKYLAGLAWACHLEPNNDRNSHYFARELMYRKYYNSAIKEFRRHIAMNGWPTERGQSIVYLGNCLSATGDDKAAKEMWGEAIWTGDARREGFLSLAHQARRENNPKLVAAFASAALEIPNNGFYANEVSNYTFAPHELLYWSKGWQGDIPAARKHIEKCLEYQPDNDKFLHDRIYYYPQRVINRIALPITRACNRACPECSALMADPTWDRKNPHVSIEELKWAGEMLGPIKTIEVTGGEPSIHPDFEEISKHIHDWFQSKDIMLLTNAVEFKRDPSKLPLLLYWDRIYISFYTPEFVRRHGTETNTGAVNVVEDFLRKNGKEFWEQRMDAHDPIGHPPYTGVCKYGYDKGDSVGYGGKRIYGCCSAYWLADRGKSIPLTKDWRDHITEIRMPCKSCFISGMVQ